MNLSRLDDLLIHYIAGHPERTTLMERLTVETTLPPSAQTDLNLIEVLHRTCEELLDSEPARVFHPLKTKITFDFYRHLGSFADINERIALDFGCGAYEAFGIGVLLWANGARGVVSLDMDDLVSSERTARFIYELALDCFCDPDAYLWPGVQRSDFIARLLELDLKGLKDGRLDTLFARAPVLHRVGDIRSIEIPPQRIDFMVSHSVIEHVAQLEDTLRSIHRLLAPNGLFCCAIDFRDHRHYSSALSPWQYLMDDGDYQPGYINKIRYTEMTGLFSRCGFATEEENLTIEPLPSEIQECLLPKYRTLDKEDLETVASYSIFRKIAASS